MLVGIPLSIDFLSCNYGLSEFIYLILSFLCFHIYCLLLFIQYILSKYHFNQIYLLFGCYTLYFIDHTRCLCIELLGTLCTSVSSCNLMIDLTELCLMYENLFLITLYVRFESFSHESVAFLLLTCSFHSVF